MKIRFSYENHFMATITEKDLDLFTGENVQRYQDIQCLLNTTCSTYFFISEKAVQLTFNYPYPDFFGGPIEFADPATIRLWLENEAEDFILNLLSTFVGNSRFDMATLLLDFLEHPSAKVSDAIYSTLVELALTDNTGSFDLNETLINNVSKKAKIIKAFFPASIDSNQIAEVKEILKDTLYRDFSLKILESIRKTTPGYADSLSKEFHL